MKLQSKGGFGEVAGNADEGSDLRSDRLSEIRKIIGRTEPDDVGVLSETIEFILLEIEKLFKILPVYMDQRHAMLVALGTEFAVLKDTRTGLRKSAESGTFSIFKFKYTTAKAKVALEQLDASDRIFNDREYLLKLLKAPIAQHVKNAQALKQFQEFNHLAPLLDAIATLVIGINQRIGEAQAIFDKVAGDESLFEERKKGRVVPLQDFRNLQRRINSLDEVWADAYLRPVLFVDTPMCRQRVPEGAQLWEMFHAWSERWEELQKEPQK